MKLLNVTKDIYRSFLVEKVFLSILEKWASSKGQNIWLQKNNARPHVSVRDNVVFKAGKKDGWEILLNPHSKNSPDINVLDPGFFYSLQKLKDNTFSKTISQLKQAINA